MEQKLFIFIFFRELGTLLSQIIKLDDVEQMYLDLMNIIKRFAEHHVIHGDFNEFNIMIRENDLKPIIIDFPQMISVYDSNAEEYFQRDVDCIKDFFLKRFNFEHEYEPKFNEIVFENIDIFRNCRVDLKKEKFFIRKFNTDSDQSFRFAFKY